MLKTFKIYACEVSGRVVYVGKTGRKFEDRIRNHLEAVVANRNPNRRLYKALKDINPVDLRWVLLELCDGENSVEREQFWIDHYRLQGPIFNVDKAVARGRPQGCINPTGQKHYAYGNPLATRKAVEASVLARKGKSHSESTKEKMRISRTRNKLNAREVENVGTSEQFPSLRAACDAIGVTRAALIRSLKTGSKCKGYVWKYV